MRERTLRLAALAAACWSGCGGAPPPAPEAPPPPPSFGAVPDAGVQLAVRPDRVASLLRQLDSLFIGGPADALGPIGPAWLRFRQRFADGVDDLFARKDSKADLLASWGLDAGVPVVVTAGMVDGTARARVLLRVLQILGATQGQDFDDGSSQAALDEALRDAPAALWHARAEFGLRDATALAAGLSGAAARLGLDTYTVGTPPPAWLGDARLPRDALWVGHDPDGGWLLLVRGEDHVGALDVVAPAAPRVAPARLVHAALQGGAPWPAEGSGAVSLALRVGAMAALEAGFSAHEALTAATMLDGQQRLDVLADAAQVTAACASRWRLLAQVADDVQLAVDLDDGHPAAVVRAQLTAAGGRAWRDALTSPVVAASADVPAGFAIRLDHDRFVGEAGAGLPGSAPLFLDEMEVCGPGHPVPGLLGAALVLPALVDLDWLPLPAAPEGPLVQRSLEGVAAVVLGFSAEDDGGAVPRVGAVAVAPDEAVSRSSDPLGDGAALEVTRDGPRWTLAGPGMPVGLARQTRPGGRQAVLLALGEGALERLEGLVAGAASGAEPAVFLDAWADPAALATDLQAAGRPGPASALAAVGNRLGRLRLRGRVDGDRLEYRLALEDGHPAAGHLATPPGPE